MSYPVEPGTDWSAIATGLGALLLVLAVIVIVAAMALRALQRRGRGEEATSSTVRSIINIWKD